MNRLEVQLGSHAYPIYIGQGLIDQPQVFTPHIVGTEVMIVSNDTLAAKYLARLQQSLSAYTCYECIIPDGEAYKTLSTWEQILEALLQRNLSRKVTLVALGGGVVGDITGFAAACYQRGVAFIQVPTSLLAQVDSSVGGKTAVNHALGKNMIGAFCQPKAVIIDIESLDTLPAREYAAGLAEVIKYGLIADAAFYHWLQENHALIMARDKHVLSTMIATCCRLKAEVVAQDETEQHLRAILNFGHTFAHAIEHIMGYGSVLHGEAVSIGMVLALKLSQILGLVPHSLVRDTAAWLAASGLPTTLPLACQFEPMLAAMGRDKKKAGTTLRFIVLQQLGEARIRDDISLTVLQKVLSDET